MLVFEEDQMTGGMQSMVCYCHFCLVNDTRTVQTGVSYADTLRDDNESINRTVTLSGATHRLATPAYKQNNHVITQSSQDGDTSELERTV